MRRDTLLSISFNTFFKSSEAFHCLTYHSFLGTLIENFIASFSFEIRFYCSLSLRSCLSAYYTYISYPIQSDVDCKCDFGTSNRNLSDPCAATNYIWHVLEPTSRIIATRISCSSVHVYVSLLAFLYLNPLSFLVEIAWKSVKHFFKEMTGYKE